MLVLLLELLLWWLLLLLLLVMEGVGMEGGGAGGRRGGHEIVPAIKMLGRAVPSIKTIVEIKRDTSSTCSRRRRAVTTKGKVGLW